MPQDNLFQLPSFRSRLAGALRRYRDSPALSDGDAEWTYGQLEHRILEFIAGLRGAGLNVGDGVGILGRNTMDYAVLQLAIPMAGMYFMSLYELESTEQHLGQIDYGDLRAVVIDPVNAPGRAEELSVELSGEVQVLTLGPALAGTDIFALASRVGIKAFDLDRDPSRIMELGLTGGTTGASKAVIDTDNVYINQALIHAANYELPLEPRMLLSTPLSHGIGSVALKTVLLLGGSAVLQPRFDEQQVLETIERERINSLLLVPSSIYRILDCDDIGRRDLTSLETLLSGGSPMSPDRVAEAIDRFGQVLVQQYGGREAKVVTTLSKRDHDPKRPDLLGSAGQPCVGVELEVLDHDLNPVEPGEMGEICTRSPASVPGYWRNPDETEQLQRGGWMHSGDLGVVDDRGYVTIKDRLKQIIISGGHNVIPRDVEDVLASHPGIRDVAVFGVPDAQWGEAVQAVVVARAGVQVTEGELRDYVKQKLGSVNSPKSIDFLTELPHTTAGKIDKKALRKPHWEGLDRAIS